MNATKEKTKADAQKQTAKKELTLAEFVDQTLHSGGTWDKMTERINKYSEKMNLKQRFSRGMINAHIKYRQVTQEKKDYLKGLKISDKGINVK